MTDRYIVPAMSMTNTEDRRPPEQHERVVILEADHVEALRQAEQRHDILAKCDRCVATGYEQGQRDALAGAIERVEALIAGPFHGMTSDDRATAVIAAIKGDTA